MNKSLNTEKKPIDVLHQVTHMDKNALADPSRICPYDQNGVLQVVIETPKGSRNKYAFDHERHIIVLKKVLPAGMVCRS